MKRLFAILFATTLLMSLMATAVAANFQATEIGLGIDTEEMLEPRYYSTCPYGDKHIMRGRGTGMVYDENDVWQFTGAATQCKNCYLVLITENNPFQWSCPYWGKYATWNPGYEVSANVVMRTNFIGYIDDKNDPYVQGFEFSLNGR